MKYCPKCEGCFFENVEIVWCETHQKEFDKYNNAECKPIPCRCGKEDWIDGLLQMTDPPSFPEKIVYRCRECSDVALERSEDGITRIRERKL